MINNYLIFFLRFKEFYFLASAILLIALNSQAQVIVTPATGPGYDYCVGGDFAAIGNIVITENELFDFGADASDVGNYTIQLPTGFEFNSSVFPALNVTGGDDIASLTNGGYNIAKTEYTFNFTLTSNGSSGKDDIDQVTISGLQVRSTSVGSGNLICSNTTNVIRTVGDNHCSLSSAVFTATLGSNDADDTFCEGTSVTFTVTPSIENAANTYNFQVDGITMQNGTSKTYVTSTLADGEEVTVIASYVNDCVATPVGITNSVVDYPVANIVSSEGSTICDGTEVEFTAAPFPSGNYEFRVNTVQVQNGSNNTYITSSLNDGDDVDVIVTASPTAAACSDNSNVISMVVDEQPVADAGTGGNECDLDFQFSASLSTVGTGVWSKVSGPAGESYDDATLENAVVTVTSYGSYVFRWTETNGGCSDFADVTVNFNEAPTADAGPASVEECDLSINLSGIQSVGGSTASWSVVAGNAADITFSNANIFNPTVSSTAYGTYTLQLTETSGSCVSTDNIDVTFTDQPIADAGTGGNECDLDFQFSASLSTVGTGVWSKVSGPAGESYDDATLENAVVTVTSYGSYVFRWTETNGGCSDFADVTVNFNEAPTADAGPASVEECDLSINLSGIQSVGGSTASWSVVAGNAADITFSNANIFNPTVSSTAYGTYTLQLTETSGSCVSTDNIDVTFTDQPIADAGTGGNECDLDFQFSASLSTVGTGVWSKVSGPAGESYDDATLENAVVTVTSYGSYVFRWTETNGGCSDFADVTVNFNEAPTADAGPASVEECDLSINLSGIQSVGGSTASWSVVAGNAADITFSNANIFNPTVSSTAYGTYTLQLTETSGSCVSTDNIDVTFTDQPIADAGTGGNECDLDFQFSASLSTVGTGVWSKVSGPAGESYDDATLENAVVTVTSYGSYVFRWTETNGGCSDFADVTVNFNEAPTADAGPASVEECDLSINLSGIQSVGGSTASWSVVAGNAADITFSNANIFNPTVSSTAYGTYTLQLTETSGSCVSTDNIDVTFTDQPIADAGTGGNECDLDFQFSASLSTVGTGVWSKVSGPAGESYDDATLENAVVTVTSYGSYVFRWTETNGGCSDFADVTVNFNEAPTADAGPASVEECDLSINLSGIQSVGGSTASWSVVAGNAADITFSNANIFNPTVSSTAYGTYTLQLTETSGSCVSTDNIDVTFTDQPIADAGTGGNECDLDFQFSASLSTVGTGVWSKVSGPAGESYDDATLENAVVTVTSYGSYVFRWTETNGGCSDFADVTVNFNEAPTADAGPASVEECDLSINLSGIQSVGGSTASWSVVAGNAADITFSNANIFNPTVSSTAYGTYTLQLTETSGSCVSTDNIDVTFTDQPIADAGTGGNECDLDFQFSASLSTVGTGVWSKVSGPAGESYDDATLENAVVTVTSYGSYVFRWTETNGGCSDFADVTVNFNEAPTADAGPASVEECDLSINLSGIQSVGGSTASWSVVAGNAADITFSNANIFNPTVSSTAYGTYTLQLTETSGSCVSTDNIDVTFTDQPIADAGTGGNECDLDFQFSASLSTVGTGVWSKVSGPAGESYDDATLENAVVTVTSYGSYVFRWTETNGGCSDFADVTVNFNEAPTADAGPASVEECDLSINLSGIQSVGGSTASWSVVAGNAADITFSNANIFNPTVSSTAYGTYTLQLTETSGSCVSTDNIDVTFTDQPIADAGTGGNECDLDFQFSASLSTVGTGVWSKVSGPAGESYDDATLENAVVTVTSYGSYVFRWTETNGGCSDFADVTVNFNEAPTADAGPASVEECDLSINLSGIQSVGGSTASWSVVAGNAADITFSNANIFNPTVSSTAYGTYTLQLTETSGSCVSTDNIDVTFTDQPIADAGTGGNECDLDFQFSASLSTVGTGVWSKVSGPAGESYDDATLENAVVTVTSYGSYVFRWTETNGGCSDFADVTVNFNEAPTADAGPASVEECDLSINLSGIQSVGGSTASWSVVAGNAADITFSNANIFNPTVSSTAYGTYTLQLTETSGSCVSTDNIDVTFTDQPIADAGTGGNECDLDFQFSASLSTVGTGVWSKVSGPAGESYDDATLENAVVTVTSYGSYVFRWTETNGGCSDFADVTVNFNEAPTADAGPASVEECDLSINLSGIQSVGGSTASWSVVAGNAADITFSNANIFNPTVSSTAYGTYTLQLTETSGSCVSTDNIDVTFTDQPIADAGTGGNECDLDFQFSASLSTVGTGVWSKVSGPAGESYDDATLENAVVTVTSYGSYVFRWTETNGGCSDFADVTVNFNEAPTADAGPASVEECDLSINLSGIQSVGGSTASWSVVAGNAADITFSNANIFNPTVSSTAYGTYTLQLTETSGSCVSTDNIDVTFTDQPIADAGTGGNECDLDFQFSASLSTVGTGVWSKVSGPAGESYDDATLENAVVTVTSYGSYVFRWTETNGGCSDFADVTVNFNEAPTADAGPASVEECDLSINLSGIQSVGGSTASWSVVAGNAADITFSNANIFNPTVSSTAYGTYTLQLTETSGSCVSTDNIDVTFTDQPIADAGTGGNECDLDFQFSASLSTVGTGVWSKVSGPAGESYDDATLENAVVTVTSYGSYVFRWTETNGGCSDFADVTVDFWENPTIATVGPDQDQCSDDIFVLTGNDPIVGTGTWTVESGSANITNPNLYNTTVTNVPIGTTAVLRWTIENGVCPSSFAELSVTNNTALVQANAGPDKVVCGSTVLEGNLPGAGSIGTWTILLGSDGLGVIADINDPKSGFEGTAGESYTLRWTISNGGICTSTTDDVVIEFDENTDLEIINANPAFCEGGITDITLNILSGTGPITLLSIDYGGGDITGGVLSGGETFIDGQKISETLFNSVNNSRQAVYTFEVSGGTCTSSGQSVAVTVYPTPEMSIINTASNICSGEAANITLNTPTENGLIRVTAVDYASITGSVDITVGQTFNNGDQILETLTNATNTIQTVSYTFEVEGNGCGPVGGFTTSIDVKPIPTMSITDANDSFCEGGSTDITLNTPTEGGVIRVTGVDYSGGDVTGGSITVGQTFTDGQKIIETLFTNTNNLEIVTYTFEVDAGGCGPVGGFSESVTVRPTPEMSITNIASNICSGEAANITLNTPTENGLIRVTAVDYASVTGSVDITVGQTFNNGDQILETLTNATNTIQTVSYTFEVEGNGCGPVGGFTTSIDVKPIPTMSITDANDSFCEGGSTDITLNTPTEGGVIRVTGVDYSGGDVTGGSITVGQTFTDGQKIIETLFTNTNNLEIVTYTFEVDAGGCGPIGEFSESVTVRPTPEMSIINTALNLCSGESANITLNTPTENGLIRVTAVDYGNVTPGGLGISVGQTFNDGGQILETLTNLTNLIELVSYTFEVEGNSCGPVGGFTTSITVNPEPTMTVVNSKTTINSGDITDILLNTPTENGQVRLASVTKPAGITGNTIPGALFPDNTRLEDILTNSTNNPLTINYEFEVIANGCVNTTTITESVTVNPAPQMTVTNNDPLLCSEELTNIEINSVTANAIIKLVDVTISPDPGGVTGTTLIDTEWGFGFDPLPVTIEDALSNVTNDIQTVTYVFEVSASGFVSTTTKSAVVTVNPNPTMTVLNTNTTINSGQTTDILLNTQTQNGQVRLKSVTKPVEITGNTIAGVLFPDGSRLEDILVNTASIPQTISYEFEAVANGCVNTTTIIEDVVVVPVAEMTLTNNTPSICSEENVDIVLESSTSGAVIELVGINITPTASSVSGITPINTTWNTYPANITDLLGNLTSNTQTVEYVFEVSAGGYTNPVTQSVFVDVKPLPDINASGIEICSGDVTNIDIWNPNSVTFTVFNWTVTDHNGNIEGEDIGTGNRITQVLNNTSTLLDSVTYRIFATAQGCAGESIDIVQYVYPQNVANAGSDTIVCQGTPAITIESASIAGGSTTASWDVVNGGGTLTGAATSMPTYTPDPADEVGTITLELTASNASVCPSVTDLVSIIINNKPTVDAGTDKIICEGSDVLLNEAVIGGSASGVTWTDASGLGSFSPNANTLNAFFIPDPAQVGSTVKLYVTTNDPTGPCDAAVDSISITIEDAPEVFAGIDQTICEGDVALLSDATQGGSTTSVTWSGGLGSFNNPGLLNATYTPDPSEIGSVVILTLTSDDPAGLCTPVSDQIRITVNKAPEVYAGADKTICEGESILIGDATTGGSTTSVLWSGGAGTFSPNATTLNATYIPDISEVNITVTLTLTTNDPAGPCIAVSDQIDIIIEQAPIVDAGIYAPVCIGDTVFLNGVIGGSATTASWTGGVGTFVNPDQLNALYVPDSVEQGGTVLLTLTTDDPIGVCNAVSAQTSITVNRLPSPKIFYLDDVYQVDDPSVNLVGEPSPGTFSGPGILGSTFIPSVADTGTHIIRYTHTDGNGCTNFTEQSTLVLALPEAEIGNPGPFCLDNQTTDNQLPRTTDPDLSDSWSGDNVSSAGGEYYFSSLGAGVGFHEVTYTVVDNITGAVTSEPRFIQVNDVAVIDFISENSCIADTIQFTDLSVLASAAVFDDEIVSWNWEIGIGPDHTSSVQNPKIKFDEDKPNDYFVRLTAVTKYGCDASSTKEINIGAIPEAKFIVKNLTLDAPTEFVDDTEIPTLGFPTGYIDPTSGIDSIWWDFGDGTTISGGYADLNPYLYQYTNGSSFNVSMRIKTDLGCYDADSFKINIIEINSIFPHYEPFDDYTGQEFEGDSASWKLVLSPQGNVINTGNNVWITSNNDNRHNNDEHSFVSLEAFDIRNLLRPMLKLDIWSNAESTRDGAALQYSFDGGVWFTLVDPNNEKPLTEQIGVNWYNERGLVGQPGNGSLSGTIGNNSSGFGWTGVYDSWRTARFPLDRIRDEMITNGFASVRFRVVFSSDEQNPDGTNYDGFAFDNLWIGDRTHNVLMEHFDNLSGANQINNMNTISDRFSLDMIPLQYHTNYPAEDEIYLNNPGPVETRGSLFDINQSPRAFMDGIKEYNFTGANIQDYQIINRSLIDPLFDIQAVVSIVGSNDESALMDITITATDTLNEEVSIYAMPIETSITGLAMLNTLGIDSLNNIAKDMVPEGGLKIETITNWQEGTQYQIPFEWSPAKIGIENIYDPTRLGVVIFVQNAVNQGTREIYQAIYRKIDGLNVSPITGLEDELNAKRIETADIYPNPAQNYFNVALSSELTQDMDWVIIDQRGVELLRGKFEDGRALYEVDANSLPNGLHMMIFNGNKDYKVIRKIIISR
jgi:hypothetical protein